MPVSGTTNWEDIQGKKYPGYGRCIYCGSDGGSDGLHDKHIIPFSLEGNAEIKEASCTTCEKQINPADTHLARAIFGNYRIHVGTQTRNPRDRPTELPARFKIDGVDVEGILPIKDHPYALSLPIWGDAGFLDSPI
jgi:hypothetical protein